MSLSLIDIGKLLLVQEESTRTASQQSGISAVTPAGIQTPTQETTKETVGSENVVFISKDNFTVPGSGLVFELYLLSEQNAKIRKLSFSTATEWTNLVIRIDGNVYKRGNYALFYDVGYSYYDPVDSLYHFDILNTNPDTSIQVTVDAGIVLDNLIVDYTVQ